MEVRRLLLSLLLVLALFGTGVARAQDPGGREPSPVPASARPLTVPPTCTEPGCNGKIPRLLDKAAITAAYCTQSGCNGKNPQGTNCQTYAYRVYGLAYPIGSFGEVELWYSTNCIANWSRATGYFGQPGVWVEQNGNQYPASHAAKGCSGNTCWSAMRDGSLTTRACGAVSAYTGCSPWG